MAVKNQELLNSMRQELSQEYQGKIDTVSSSDDVRNVLKTLNDYPTLKNEFLDFLTNKVIMSKFYSKVFENPLKMFHRGTLEYGTSIEQLFINMAEKKGFNQRFDNSSNEEQDLIASTPPTGYSKYISRNFMYKYKVTISEDQLRGAFYSSTGLSELVSQVLNSLTSGAYFDEFNDMKKLLSAVCQGKHLTFTKDTGLYAETDLTKGNGAGDEIKAYIANEIVTNYDANPKALSEKIKALSSRLTFPSIKYNMAEVKQWSKPEDLVFITTPEVEAKLSVEVLASAFNVSMAEIKTRTVIVDELPTKLKTGTDSAGTDKTFLGLLVDKDFLQVYDTLMTMKKFDNGANLTVNNFLHKQGILANCFFANAIAITKD
ncbi:MAG: hypothetical protein ACRCXT_00725 [Paraclostridium sp.]